MHTRPVYGRADCQHTAASGARLFPLQARRALAAAHQLARVPCQLPDIARLGVAAAEELPLGRSRQRRAEWELTELYCRGSHPRPIIAVRAQRPAVKRRGNPQVRKRASGLWRTCALYEEGLAAGPVGTLQQQLPRGAGRVGRSLVCGARRAAATRAAREHIACGNPGFRMAAFRTRPVIKRENRHMLRCQSRWRRCHHRDACEAAAALGTRRTSGTAVVARASSAWSVPLRSSGRAQSRRLQSAARTWPPPMCEERRRSNAFAGGRWGATAANGVECRATKDQSAAPCLMHAPSAAPAPCPG
jgi:hypothetical protein